MTTLASLALSAESLASRHAPATGVPPLQKTLAELEAEAARLNAQQQQPSQNRGEALLAQSTFDAEPYIGKFWSWNKVPSSLSIESRPTGGI